jgi:hypothetical protein
MITANVLELHSPTFVTLPNDSAWTEMDDCGISIDTSVNCTNYAFVSLNIFNIQNTLQCD